MSINEAKVMGFHPRGWERVWRALGFKFSAFAGRPDEDDTQYMVQITTTHWDFMDRLRILVSGVTQVELCVEIESEPITFLDGAAQMLKLNVTKTRGGVAVIVPGSRSQ